ncbi:MAG: hypothetical protein WC999_15660 [Hydrogenophaga sp.]|jgi:hypothetical protein
MKTEFFAKLLEAAKLTGLKTYIAGGGLIALGVYQISEGNVEEGVTTVLAGWGACGFRAAIDKAR